MVLLFKSISRLLYRSFSTCQKLLSEKKNSPGEKVEPADDVPVKKGWFEKILNVRTIAPSKESHASQLSSKETLYEIMCMYILYSNIQGWKTFRKLLLVLLKSEIVKIRKQN